MQWLTIGRGVTHRGIPLPHVHGLVLWVNLSAHHKMIRPRIQEIQSAQIPVEESNGVRVALIAGKSVANEVGWNAVPVPQPTLSSTFALV